MPNLCGAKTRAGSPCQKFGMVNGRCKLHGGKTPKGVNKGNKHAVRHGLYAKGLKSEELEIWHDISVGSLDDEIRLAKILLRRGFAAKAIPHDILAMYLRRIERLEATRSTMIAQNPDMQIDPQETARKIREYLKQAEAATSPPKPQDA